MSELHNKLLEISGELGKAVDLDKIDVKIAINLNHMLSQAINYMPHFTELCECNKAGLRGEPHGHCPICDY